MSITCDFCGKAGLSWGPAHRLVNPDGTIHACEEYFKARGAARPAAPAQVPVRKVPAPAPELDPDKIKCLDDLGPFTHWRTGDVMAFQGKDTEIWEIAVLEDPKDKTCCRVLYFDEDEKCFGWQKMKLEKPNA